MCIFLQSSPLGRHIFPNYSKSYFYPSLNITASTFFHLGITAFGAKRNLRKFHPSGSFQRKELRPGAVTGSKSPNKMTTLVSKLPDYVMSFSCSIAFEIFSDTLYFGIQTENTLKRGFRNTDGS